MTDIEKKRRRKRRKRRKRILRRVMTALIIIIVLCIIALAAALFSGFKISDSDTNLKNVYVGGIDVGGKTIEETEAILNEHGWEEKSSAPLHVNTIGGVSFDISPLDAGLALSTKDAAQAAFDYGRQDGPLGALSAWFKAQFNPADVNTGSVEADRNYIMSFIDKAVSEVDGYMAGDEYTIDTENEQLVLKKGWNQIKIDKEAFCDAVIDALKRGESEMSFNEIVGTLDCPDFDAIHTLLEREPVEARFTDDGTFTVIDEVVGCKFDVAQAKQLWANAAPGEVVSVPLDITWPAVTGESLRSTLYHDLLGTCTTKFPNSVEARRNNLKLALDKINNYVMYPGDVFSYNGIVGVRTEEAGFLPAPAYVNGDTKDEIGGGVCQVASTLYASTLFAFIETVERECHYFPPNYMQMGTDATVTIPAEGRAIDFKFMNNKNYPIKIVTYFNNEESYMTVEIWGTLEEDDYMPIEFDNSYGWSFDFDRVIDPAYPDRPGYKIKLEHETYGFEDDVGNGYRTLTHRYVIDEAGNTIQDDITNMRLENGNAAMDTYYQHN